MHGDFLHVFTISVTQMKNLTFRRWSSLILSARTSSTDTDRCLQPPCGFNSFLNRLGMLMWNDVNSWFPMLKSSTGYANRSCCIFPILSKSWTKAVQTEIGWWPSVQALHWVHIHLTLNLMMIPMRMISVPLLQRTKLWSEAIEDSGGTFKICKNAWAYRLTCICVGLSFLEVALPALGSGIAYALPAKNGKLAKSSPTKSSWIPLPRSIFLKLCIGTVHSFL